MSVNTKPTVSADEEITLKELILKLQDWRRYLLSKWVVVLISGLIGGSLGLVYSLFQKPTYTATLTFVLEEDSKGVMGNLGGLAAIAGFNLGSDGGGVFQGDNIIELYKSRSMLTNSLLSKANDNDSLLIERYISFNEFRDGWQEQPQLNEISFAIPRENYTLQHDSLIGIFVDQIRKSLLDVSKIDKVSGLIQVETTSINEGFSKDFTELLVDNVNKFYVETKTKKSLNNLGVIQHQTDSVRQELNDAIGGVASAMDANPNANLARQRLSVPSAKRQVDVQANQAILTELVKNLELAKIGLRKETPLIQIIDVPVLPLKFDKVGKIKYIVVGGVLIGFLMCLYLITKRFLSAVMEGEKID